MAKCIIYGHTGAVGEFVLKEVMSNAFFSKVTTLGRRKIDYNGVNPEKLNQVIVNFEAIDQHKEAMKECDIVFCTLGTTRREAGSAENFWKIDHDYVVNTAKLIHEANMDIKSKTSSIHFLYCSAQGSNIDSMFLYPKCKGTVEKDLSDMGFQSVSIFQPGLIEISKERTHGKRMMESLALAVLPVFKYMSPRGISCPASTIAQAMVYVSTQPELQHKFILFQNKKLYELVDRMNQPKLEKEKEPQPK